MAKIGDKYIIEIDSHFEVEELLGKLCEGWREDR